MSWLRETWNSLSLSSNPNKLEAEGEEHAKPMPIPAAPAARVTSMDWTQGVNQYWSGVAASMGHPFSKDDEFSLVDRFTGSAVNHPDSKKETEEIESQCKALHDGKGNVEEVWKAWVKKLKDEAAHKYYDKEADEIVSFKDLLLRTSAVQASLGCCLRSPGVIKDGSAILELLDHCLIGNKEDKDGLMMELSKLAQTVDGTAYHERIEKLVQGAVQQVKRDLRYEDAMREAHSILQQVRDKEDELKVLPEIDPDDLDGIETLGDEDLRERVARSAELLDRNASMRHLITVAQSMLTTRGEDSTYFRDAKEQITSLKAKVANDCAAVQQKVESTSNESVVLRNESKESEERLSKSEKALSDRRDRFECSHANIRTAVRMIGFLLSGSLVGRNSWRANWKW